MTRKYFLLLLITITCTLCKAQEYNGSVNSFIQLAGKYQFEHQPEKIYLQLDKNNYNLADTLWFKAYLFNAISLRASAISAIVYIEISDESNIVQVRKRVIMNNGLGQGAIALNRRDFPEGGYTLRAYTQWMRNFDENYIFKNQFLVSNLNANKWLVHYNTAVKDKAAQLHLELTDMDHKPVTGQQIQLGVKQGEKVLQWDKIQTISSSGTFDLGLAVKDKPEPIYASLQKAVIEPGGGFAGFGTSMGADPNAPLYKFPIFYNRPEKADVQFMPEGGYMVAGIPSVVGFKAIGEDGKGTPISGSIINAITNETVASFTSLYKGMGRVAFTPQAGVTYKAVIALPGAGKKEYAFPLVKPSGTVLSVSRILNDSLAIKVSGTAGHYILLGQSREQVCFAARVVLNGKEQSFAVSSAAFASGIVKFTLLSEQLNTLNERLIYVNHQDNLSLLVTTNQASYTPQDSIALHLEVKDKAGNPVQGAFAMAIVNSLADAPDPDNPDITSSTLLTSDLKGYVETPDYYFTPGHEKELDNLLLTQGWTAFDWKQLLMPEKLMAYPAEPDISISGKVTNLLGKPVKNATINIFSLRPFFTIDTLTDEKGGFLFKALPQIDSTIYIGARNKNGNKSAYGIAVDRTDWPAFPANRVQQPWYVNDTPEKLKLNDSVLKTQQQLEKLEGMGKTLNEVTIREKKIVPGSHNLNGSGNADQVIDEHDIAKEKPMTLLELLKKTVKGFGIDHRGGKLSYVIDGGAVAVIFDGIDTRYFIDPKTYSINGNPDYDYYKSLFDYYTSDDIKGIEVMSVAYRSLYNLHHYDPRCRRCLFDLISPAYIEITTREGNGPFLKKNAADLLYKPVPSVLQKEFYRPRYQVKNAALAAFDDRATIHWEPNIITDKDGKATVSFYAAGQPGIYTVTTEGSNMNGDVGSAVQKITVKANTP